MFAEYNQLTFRVQDLEMSLQEKGNMGIPKKAKKMTQTTREIGIQTEKSEDTMEIEKPLSFRLVDCRKLKKLVRYEKIYKRKIEKMLVEPIVSKSSYETKKVKSHYGHYKMMRVFLPKETLKEETKQMAMEIEWSKEQSNIEDKIPLRPRARKRKASKVALPEKLKRPRITNDAPSKVLGSIKIYDKPSKQLKFKQTDLKEFFSTVSKPQLKYEKGQPNLFVAGKIT